MKKLIALVMVACFLVLAASCTAKPEAPASSDVSSEAGTSEPAVNGKGDDPKSEGVMTYAEYLAAEVDSAVTVECFVQAKQSWWEDKATVYAADSEGGYLLYNMECSEADYAKLVTGTKIKVTGYKQIWSGEIEIAEATFEIEGGSTYVAEPVDVTALLGTDELINKQNLLVSFTGLTVAAANDEGATYLYKWDGSGEDGDDLYFNATIGDATYSFTVESYLCDKDSEVYNAVKNLKVGDNIDMVGFLYWYEGMNPHITTVTVK